MAYKNFIPRVWANQIERELERNHVFVSDTNRKYEGSVKNRGDSVKILGIGKPTVTRTKDGDIVLGDPETVEDTSATLVINQIAYFNYMVGDIDKAQAVGGVMEALAAETTEALNDEMDRFVAGFAGEKTAVLDQATPYTVTPDNVYEMIDRAQQMLWENDVKPSAKLTVVVPPKFYMIMRQAQIKLDTDNSGVIKNGVVGRYGSIVVRQSNNVLKAGDGHKIQLKTDRAVAFVNPMTHVEPYRPEKRFADAVKGYVLFDGKIVRPKEMVVLNVKYA